RPGAGDPDRKRRSHRHLRRDDQDRRAPRRSPRHRQRHRPNPLMAIDRDLKSYWMSDPDGATPKQLTVDMKDLRIATRVRLSTPDVTKNAPVRGDLYGSQDGEFWFRIASHPERPAAAPVSGVYG